VRKVISRKIITLCGSTKFKKEFKEAVKHLTLEDNIVLSVGLFGHSGDEEAWAKKEMLDNMHFEKIRMSDAIYVINKNGYIGDSTSYEIIYAKCLKKEIMYLENADGIAKKEEIIDEKIREGIITEIPNATREKLIDGGHVPWKK